MPSLAHSQVRLKLHNRKPYGYWRQECIPQPGVWEQCVSTPATHSKHFRETVCKHHIYTSELWCESMCVCVCLKCASLLSHSKGERKWKAQRISMWGKTLTDHCDLHRPWVAFASELSRDRLEDPVYEDQFPSPQSRFPYNYRRTRM